MKKTGQKTDYVMKYFSVIRIISAIAIALLIVFAIIFMDPSDSHNIQTLLL